MTIRAITVRNTISKAVLNCKDAINNYSSNVIVHTIWVPSRHKLIENEESNILANRAKVLYIPASALKTNLRKWAKTSHRLLWDNDTIGGLTKILWLFPNEDESMTILKLNDGDLITLMSVLTGHSALHVFRDLASLVLQSDN